MRRARHLLWIFALAALAAGPSYATSVTVLISGVWDDSVIDDLGVIFPAIVLGSSYTATLVFDDSTDADPPNSGNYVLEAASTDLVVSTGGVTFSLPSTATISFGIEDDAGQDAFGFLTDIGNFTASGLAAGASTGVGYAQLSMIDSSETALSSSDLTDLTWDDANAYDNTNFYFLIETFKDGDEGVLELSGAVTSLSVLPEPSAISLMVFVGAALVAIRYRG